MTQLAPLLALIAAAAVLLAALRLVANAYNETGRQILRGLRKVLKGAVEAFIIDYGHGSGVGFNFTSMMMAVAWDAGEWCRVYSVDELLGVELMVDGRAEGWAFAKGRLWSADEQMSAERQVALRHVFDDPHHPDFMLELWSTEREQDDTIPDARTAIEKGNRWLEGMAALMATIQRRRIEIEEAA
jgi:hypothetical protein